MKFGFCGFGFAVLVAFAVTWVVFILLMLRLFCVCVVGGFICSVCMLLLVSFLFAMLCFVYYAGLVLFVSLLWVLVYGCDLFVVIGVCG